MVNTVMMAPAIATPRKIAGTAWRIRISSRAATRAPVQAPVPGRGNGHQDHQTQQPVASHQEPLQVGPALQPDDLRPQQLRVAQPGKGPADQQQNEGHRHHVPQDGGDTGRGRRQARRHTYRDSAPQLHHRHHGGEEGQQQFVEHGLNRHPDILQIS